MTVYRYAFEIDGWGLLMDEIKEPENLGDAGDVRLEMEAPLTNSAGYEISGVDLSALRSLATLPSIKEIRLVNPGRWFLRRWDNRDPKYLELAGKLVLDGADLARILENSFKNRWSVNAGKALVNMYVCLMHTDNESTAKALSRIMEKNYTRYTRKVMYGCSEMHPWLCEHGFVKASTYEDMLEACGGVDNSYLIAWARKNGIPEKVEKLREARMERPISIEKARKIWTVRLHGDSYRIDLKDNKVGNLIIPDRIGGKKVAEAWIIRRIDDNQIDRVVLPKGVRLYAQNMKFRTFLNFSEVLYRQDYECAGSPAVYEIPENKTVISTKTFSNCPLQSVRGLDHVRVIESFAFSNTKLTDGFMEIPESVKTVGNQAFADCGIESFRISDTLETIGFLAFSGAKKIFCSPAMSARIAGAASIRDEQE